MYSLHDLLDLENRVSFVLGNSGNVAAAAATTTTTTNTKYIYFFFRHGENSRFPSRDPPAALFRKTGLRGLLGPG